MIEELRVGETANFHVLKKQLTNSAISDLFRALRKRVQNPSQNLFAVTRQQVGDARYSAICFLYDTSPSFLTTGTGVIERVCGFLLIVEHRGHAAVFKAALDFPSSFVTEHFGRVPSERIELAVASGDAVFEKIRLRNMSLSKAVMRSKTLEADDLQTAVGPASSSRYVPRGYAVRTGSDVYTTTPSTGRIGRRSDKVGHLDLVGYATGVIDLIVDAAGAPAAFINNFARSLELSALGGIAASSFAVDVASLNQALHETGEIRLVREVAGGFEELPTHETEQLATALSEVFDVTSDGDGKERSLRRAGDGAEVGTITFNKSRIAFSRLDLPFLAGVDVESTDYPLGEDPARLPIRRFLDRADLFIVLFDDIALAYIDGNLFRDGGITAGGDEFLRHLRAEPSLANVVSEKGNFAVDQTVFDPTSTFGVVVSSTSDGEEILVCDDLGNEWADFIGISNNSSPPRISFYHAKHGDLSIGASPFHDAVGQAMKNLGNMALPAIAMPAKFAAWQGTYTNDEVATSISRTIRTTQNGVAHEVEEVRLAPDAIKRVFIVTSSLSLQVVRDRFASIAAGHKPNPYFVQLYWLLVTYFSACAEMNAQGYVVCRP